jgi:hypothetical protein
MYAPTKAESELLADITEVLKALENGEKLEPNIAGRFWRFWRNFEREMRIKSILNSVKQE